MDDGSKMSEETKQRLLKLGMKKQEKEEDAPNPKSELKEEFFYHKHSRTYSTWIFIYDCLF